jgi:hypothetical protein
MFKSAAGASAGLVDGGDAGCLLEFLAEAGVVQGESLDLGGGEVRVLGEDPVGAWRRKLVLLIPSVAARPRTLGRLPLSWHSPR